MDLGQIFEGGMMLCFGVSWPMQIIKTVRTKNPMGKSFFFLWLVFIGYLAGIMSKVVSGQIMAPVVILYVLNTLMVGTDLSLSYYYQNRLKKQKQV